MTIDNVITEIELLDMKHPHFKAHSAIEDALEIVKKFAEQNPVAIPLSKEPTGEPERIEKEEEINEAFKKWVVELPDTYNEYRVFEAGFIAGAKSGEIAEVREWVVEIMNRGILLPSDRQYQYALNNFLEVNNGIYKWKQTYQQ